jgi:hypothetical protein
MTSSRKNIIAILYESGRTVFRLKDIALFTGQTDALLLAKRLNNMVVNGELINLRKGIYALKDYRKEELASKIFTPSYLSIDYVLQKEGVIFQYDPTYTSISYLSRTIEINGSILIFRKIKNELLVNTAGIRITQDGISMAIAERAFLDYLYLNGDCYIDNPSILNRKQIKEILPIYNSPTLYKRVTKVLNNV